MILSTMKAEIGVSPWAAQIVVAIRGDGLGAEAWFDHKGTTALCVRAEHVHSVEWDT